MTITPVTVIEKKMRNAISIPIYISIYTYTRISTRRKLYGKEINIESIKEVGGGETKGLYCKYICVAISCIEYKMRLMLGTENQNGRLRCRRREKNTSGNKKDMASFNFLVIF